LQLLDLWLKAASDGQFEPIHSCGEGLDLAALLRYNTQTIEAASFDRLGEKHAVDSTRF
jgi:hypothetical protein